MRQKQAALSVHIKACGASRETTIYALSQAGIAVLHATAALALQVMAQVYIIPALPP